MRICDSALGPEEVAKLFNNGAGTEGNNIGTIRLTLKEGN